MAWASTAAAQVNAKGRVQLGLGLDLGLHATHFTHKANVLGLVLEEQNRDGAATVTYPFDAQIGLSDRFSLGLCLEPGRYIDSAGTHPNKLFLASIAPRYYAVNKDHFALYLNANLGLGWLRIGNVIQGLNRYDDLYNGTTFCLGTVAQWYFGEVVGLNLGLKYAANTLQWRERTPRDPVLDKFKYSALLQTSGVVFQLGLQVKL